MAERPSQSEESFKKFLEDLKKQNTRALATDILQIKLQREIAGEDDDKREEQLDDLIKSSEKIEKAITGFQVSFDIQPLVDSLGNTATILTKQLEELTLTRKLTEGSLAYDRESAQYRNMSGRELTSVVSGKAIQKGGYIDFESAADRLTGQGKRVRESASNQLNLAPISIASGIRTASSLAQVAPAGNREREQKKLTGVEVNPDDRTWKEFGKDIMSLFGFKGGGQEIYNSTKGRYAEEFVKAGKGTEREGMLEYERRIKEEKETAKAEMFGFNGKLKPTPAVANPESDNIETPAEIQAKASQEDLELSKQNKTIFQQQLLELKAIREALGAAPPTSSSKASVPSNVSTAGTSGEDINIPSSPGKAMGKGGTFGSRATKFLTGRGGAVLGGAIAVGAGAYTAYQGYSAAEDSKQAKMENIQAQLNAGQINEKQASELRKEAGNTATVEKSSAVGSGTGMAAGGIAGMKAGALIGTALGGPIGTVVGGAVGGAAGMFAGSAAGKWVGEKAGQGINAVKDFFGSEASANKMIGSEPFVPGKPLTTGQMSTIAAAKAKGSKFPPEVEAQYAKQKASLASAPSRMRGPQVAQTSTENQAIRDVSATAAPSTTTVVNNVGGGRAGPNFVPMKPSPRVESSLTRYQNRIAVY